MVYPKRTSAHSTISSSIIQRVNQIVFANNLNQSKQAKAAKDDKIKRILSKIPYSRLEFTLDRLSLCSFFACLVLDLSYSHSISLARLEKSN